MQQGKGGDHLTRNPGEGKPPFISTRVDKSDQTSAFQLKNGIIHINIIMIRGAMP
jgi:hypothetical protein